MKAAQMIHDTESNLSFHSDLTRSVWAFEQPQ
jgi:hypothetical protein